MRVQSVRWKIARRHLKPRRRHWLRWTILVLFLVLLASTGGAAAAGVYFASQLPRVSSFRVHYAFQDARIYDVRGNLLYDMANLAKESRGYRVVEPLQGLHDHDSPCRNGVNRIPRILQDATIATEDATFYKNPGFDALSIVRAAYQNVRYGHIVSGASTITQQVVRDYFLQNQQQTFTRKAQEVALAYQISQRVPKRKILWYYLNSVPYGNLAYGAQAASHVYFGVPVCGLDMAQVALLAGLPRGPSLYNPVKNRLGALRRMRTVLRLMRLHGYLHSRSEIDAAMQEAARWRFSAPQPRMRYPQFVQYVIDRMNAAPQLKSQIYKGIDVYTTLDPRLQNMAQDTVTRQIDRLRDQHVTNGALVSLDVRPEHYGWILAMVGSAHYSDKTGQLNMATRPRQPGSSMKPFNYVWAFTHGNVTPGTTVIDSPVRLPDPHNVEGHGWYEPANYDRKYHGTVTLREALANSLNLPAVKVEYYITSPKHVAQTAYQFGMTSLYGDNPQLDCGVCYAVTLGGLTNGSRLLEETSAYGVFATSGSTVPPVAIWKIIRRSSGKTLYCEADCAKGVSPATWLVPHRRSVLDPGHAYQMNDVLSDDSARCTLRVCEFGLNSSLVLSRPAAAKTGTTNSFTDNWTVGYTPQIVTGVWTGNSDRSPMNNVIGVTGAAPIWHDFMENAFQILKLPVQPFIAPSTVISSGQCTNAGSTYASFGAVDLQVLPQGRLPLCLISERGFMPATCSGTYTYGQFVTPQPCAGYGFGANGNGVNQYGNGYQQPYSPPASQQSLPLPVVPQPVQPGRGAPTVQAPAPAATTPPVAVPPALSNPPDSPPVRNPPDVVQPVPTAPPPNGGLP